MRWQWGGWLIFSIGSWQVRKSPGAASGTIFQEQIDVRSGRILGSAAVA